MKLEDLRFFDPRREIAFSGNRLPHWQQEGGVYFVTFRLGDAVPKELLDRWGAEREVWRRLHPEPWTDAVEREYHERFTVTMERWLDAGHGACVLRRRECAGVVAEALGYFEGKRCDLLSWVVMPNHVHVLFTLRAGYESADLMHSWKRFTARRVNAMSGRTGGLWQKDYFDRLVRDAMHFARCVRYVRKNPEKAGLRDGEYLRWESEVARGIE